MKIKKLLTHAVLLTLILYGFYYLEHELKRENTLPLLSIFSLLFILLWYWAQHFNSLTNIFLLGVFSRAIFMFHIPEFSQDFYRFIWDGRLITQGISPYLFTPESYIENTSNSFGVIINQAQELYNGMGSLNGSHFSNYPPINQLCFSIASFFTEKSILGSVVVLRVIIILADLGILFIGKKLLLKLHLNPNQIFWYFLNPFIIIELTGNLHFEGVMLFFLIASLYLLHQKKWLGSAFLLGISVSVKLIPLLLLPLYYKWFIHNFNKGYFKLAGFYFIVLGTVILTFTPFYHLNSLLIFLKQSFFGFKISSLMQVSII